MPPATGTALRTCRVSPGTGTPTASHTASAARTARFCPSSGISESLAAPCSTMRAYSLPGAGSTVTETAAPAEAGSRVAVTVSRRSTATNNVSSGW